MRCSECCLLSDGNCRSALVSHAAVAEAAVVGVPHAIKGCPALSSLLRHRVLRWCAQAKPVCVRHTKGWRRIVACADEGASGSIEVAKRTDHRLATRKQLVVRTQVGAFATPDEILITTAVPKTRSGKIMRYALRAALPFLPLR